MTPLDAALAYITRGWSPIPCKPRSKIPLNKNWEQLTITAADAAQHFRDDRLNVGVRLGPASKNLVDIDLDCDEAVDQRAVFVAGVIRCVRTPIAARQPLVVR